MQLVLEHNVQRHPSWDDVELAHATSVAHFQVGETIRQLGHLEVDEGFRVCMLRGKSQYEMASHAMVVWLGVTDMGHKQNTQT
eukprot:5813424-Amphidinium_carterae.1